MVEPEVCVCGSNKQSQDNTIKEFNQVDRIQAFSVDLVSKEAGAAISIPRLENDSFVLKVKESGTVCFVLASGHVYSSTFASGLSIRFSPMGLANLKANQIGATLNLEILDGPPGQSSCKVKILDIIESQQQHVIVYLPIVHDKDIDDSFTQVCTSVPCGEGTMAVVDMELEVSDFKVASKLYNRLHKKRFKIARNNLVLAQRYHSNLRGCSTKRVYYDTLRHEIRFGSDIMKRSNISKSAIQKALASLCFRKSCASICAIRYSLYNNLLVFT